MNIASMKVDRAIRLFQNFDELDEKGLKTILNCLSHALDIHPSKDYYKDELYGYIKNLSTMPINKYGGIFKATNWKNSVILNKDDVSSLILQVISLMY